MRPEEGGGRVWWGMGGGQRLCETEICGRDWLGSIIFSSLGFINDPAVVAVLLVVTEDVFACIVFPSEEKASTSEEWAVIMGVWTRKKKCRVVVCSLECFCERNVFLWFAFRCFLSSIWGYCVEFLWLMLGDWVTNRNFVGNYRVNWI